MQEYTSDDVNKAIRNVFPKNDPAEIMDIICEYGSEDYEKEPYRVYLAILKNSKGDIDRLLDAVQLAKIDYRDAIVAAEYTNLKEGWDKWTPIDNPYKDILK